MIKSSSSKFDILIWFGFELNWGVTVLITKMEVNNANCKTHDSSQIFYTSEPIDATVDLSRVNFMNRVLN